MKENKHFKRLAALILAAALILNTAFGHSSFVWASSEATTVATAKEETTTQSSEKKEESTTKATTETTTDASKEEAEQGTTKASTEKGSETTTATEGTTSQTTEAKDAEETTGLTDATTEEKSSEATTATGSGTVKREKKLADPPGATTCEITIAKCLNGSIKVTYFQELEEGKSEETSTNGAGTITAVKNTKVTATFIPDSGYYVNSYTLGETTESGEDVDEKTLSIESLSEDITVKAEFSEISIRLKDTIKEADKNTWLDSAAGDGKEYSFSNFLTVEPENILENITLKSKEDGTGKSLSTVKIDNTTKKIQIPYTASGKTNPLVATYDKIKKEIDVPVKKLELSDADYQINGTLTKDDWYQKITEIQFNPKAQNHGFNQYKIKDNGEWSDISKRFDGTFDEGDNSLQMRYYDKENSINNYESEQVKIKLDSTAPEITNVTVNGEKQTVDKETWYNEENLTITFQVEDKLSGVKGVYYSTIGYDDKDAKTLTGEKDGKGNFVYTIQCVEGKETYYIWAKDKVENITPENEAVSKSVTVNYDKTAPEITNVTVNGEKQTVDKETWYNEENLTITFQVEDNLSGVKEVYYSTTGYKQDPKLLTGEKDDKENVVYTIQCVEGKETYYIWAKDKMENITPENKVVSESVNYDKTAPDGTKAYVQYNKSDKIEDSSGNISLFERAANAIKKYFAKNRLTIKVFVRDTIPEGVNDVSGIQSVTGEYGEDNLKNWKAENDVAVINDIVYQVFKAEIKIEEGKIESKKGKFKLTSIKDNAGNTLSGADTEVLAEDATVLYVDNTPPELTVDLTSNNTHYKDTAIYYNSDYTPSFEIEEANFYDDDKKQNGTYKYSVKKVENEVYSPGEGSWGDYPSSTFTAKAITAEEDEIETYLLQFSYTDGSNNKMIAGQKAPVGGSIEKGTFTSMPLIVDKENPVINNVHFYNNNTDNKVTNLDAPIYITNSDANDFILTFSITETYLKEDTVKVTAVNQETKETKEFTLGSEDGKLVNEEDNDFTFYFDEEGTWKFKISAQDKAGNETVLDEETPDSVLAKEVILDHTAPKLEVAYGKEWTNATDENANDVDSKKISENTVECFIREATDVTFTLTEKNAVAQEKSEKDIGEKKLKIKDVQLIVYYQANDKAEPEQLKEFNQPVWTAGEKDTYTYTLPIDKEGHYTFTLTYKDPAGNAMEPKPQDSETANCLESGTYTSPTITVDKTDPVIETTFSSKPENTQDGRDYYQKALDMTITITEENFRAAEFDLNYHTYYFKENGSKSDVKSYDDNKIGKTDAEWKSSWVKDEKGNEKQVWTMVVPWSKEVNYNIAYSYEDLSKRTGKNSDKIAIDGNKPEIVITEVEGTELSDMIFSNNKSGNKLLDFINYTHYSYFGQDKVYSIITAHDDISGVKSICYEVIDENGQVLENDVLENDSEDLGKWTGKAIVMDADFKGQVHAYAVDRSLNEGDTMDPKGVVSETEGKHKETSNVKITTLTKPSRSVGSTNYYNKPVKVNLYISDSQSGIQSYKYKAGTSIESGKDYKDNPGSKDVEANEVKNQYVLDDTVTMPAGDTNYTNAKEPTKVEISYVDNAGYTGQAEEKYVIDDKKPEIEVSWTSAATVQNKKYYNQTRVAHITVTERNFDESGVKWDNFGDSGRKGVVISGWSHSGDKHTATVSFTEDGDFDLKFTITDYATNSYTWDQAEEFTIDKTAPVLSISFDNNNAANGKYYKSPRTATLHIVEHNFNASDVTYQMTASNDGKGIGGPSVGGWSTGGDNHSASIHYGSDGDYTLGFNYTDMAGNKAKEVKAADFTIDLTKPECEITNINDHSANNDTVAPGIKFSDTNLEQYTVSLVGNKNGRVTYDTEAPLSIHNGKTQQWKDFERKEEVDDIYTMELIVTDKAGNQSKASKLFSVNRFGSNYLFGNETQELLDKYYSNQEIELDVTEVNVNTLEKKEITVRDENNEIRTLQEGADYTVKESSNRYNWKQYNYKVNASVFEEENQYTVTLYSEDKATNKMNNESKDKSIEFVIDKTAPTGVISGLEKDRYREDNHEIYVRAMDNYQLDKASLMVDGQEFKSMTAADFNNQDQTVKVSLPSKAKSQTIGLEIVDKAGNVGIVDDVNCVISSSLWVQYVTNKPLLYTTSGVGGLAVLGIIGYLTKGFGYGACMASQSGFWWILLGKKKEDEDEEEN